MTLKGWTESKIVMPALDPGIHAAARMGELGAHFVAIP
jgi:hypothetical protein